MNQEAMLLIEDGLSRAYGEGDLGEADELKLLMLVCYKGVDGVIEWIVAKSEKDLTEMSFIMMQLRVTKPISILHRLKPGPSTDCVLESVPGFNFRLCKRILWEIPCRWL